MPYYDYEHIPDFTYEEVEQRIAEMDTDMPFELNETIFAFINYFTVRNREYTRMVLERQGHFSQCLIRIFLSIICRKTSSTYPSLNPD